MAFFAEVNINYLRFLLHLREINKTIASKQDKLHGFIKITRYGFSKVFNSII